MASEVSHMSSTLVNSTTSPDEVSKVNGCSRLLMSNGTYADIYENIRHLDLPVVQLKPYDTVIAVLNHNAFVTDYYQDFSVESVAFIPESNVDTIFNFVSKRSNCQTLVLVRPDADLSNNVVAAKERLKNHVKNLVVKSFYSLDTNGMNAEEIKKYEGQYLQDLQSYGYDCIFASKLDNLVGRGDMFANRLLAAFGPDSLKLVSAGQGVTSMLFGKCDYLLVPESQKLQMMSRLEDPASKLSVFVNDVDGSHGTSSTSSTNNSSSSSTSSSSSSSGSSAATGSGRDERALAASAALGGLEASALVRKNNGFLYEWIGSCNIHLERKIVFISDKWLALNTIDGGDGGDGGDTPQCILLDTSNLPGPDGNATVLDVINQVADEFDCKGRATRLGGLKCT